VQITLKETLSIEDYDDLGYLPLDAFKDAINSLDMKDLTPTMIDYLVFYVFSRSESIEKLKYNVIFEILEGKAKEQV